MSNEPKGIVTISAFRDGTRLVARALDGAPIASRWCRGWADARMWIPVFAKQTFGVCSVKLTGDNAWTVTGRSLDKPDLDL